MSETTAADTADNGIAHIIDIPAEPVVEETVEDSATETIEEVVEEKAEDKPEEEKRKEHTKVSHAALHEERQMRKESERLLKEEKARAAKYEETLQKVLAKVGAQEPEEVDLATKLENGQEDLKTKIERIETAEKQKEALTQFVTKYQGSVEAYKLDQPDYPQAFNHLYNSRKEELSILIPDPVELKRVLEQEEVNIVNEAYRLGKNPGEIFYAMAKQRGYGKPVENKIERLEKGLNASRSLGSGGSKPDSGISLDNLAQLSDEEFNRTFAEFEKKARR